ncbi:MAG: OB-fold nucleic acid binding domain-containing protein [Pirellulaceae bacterium]
MSRNFANQLSDGQSIDEVFIASEKQLRPNRSGNLYLQLRCSDKSGTVTCMMWNAEQRHYDSFENGDYVRIQGTAQLYNGNMQVIAKSVKKSISDVDPADFETRSSAELDELFAELAGKLRSMRNYHLRNLAESFLVDDELMASFRRAPAGVKNHHAYCGGLLEHVVSLIRVAQAVAPFYAEVDVDLLTCGVFLHDIGKVEELTYSPDLGYSDSGQLVGHIVQGVRILDRRIETTEKQSGEPFPTDLADQLRHMIVSHHGDLEYGSPRVPMTFEALVLHHLDNLDAKVGSFRQVIADDANAGSQWTSYNPQLGRKVYKPAGQ